MTQIAFRIDADAVIGSGHFMRCLPLANELKQRGAKCEFLCLSIHPSLQVQATDQGHSFQIFPDEQDIIQYLESNQPDWLVIDHYLLDNSFEQTVAAFCGAVMVIEDLDRPNHTCALLLDQSALKVPEDYKDIVSPDCVLLLGPQYALLRPEFREHKKKSARGWTRGLICFGGADPDNISLKLLEVIAAVPALTQLHWTLIAGPANPHRHSLEAFSQTGPLQLEIIPSSDQIARLMAEHDFAIGAAGGMTWERACVGIPTLAMPIADNQLAGIRILEHFSLAETTQLQELNPAKLLSKLHALQEKSKEYLQKNQEFVDGMGAGRVCEAMLSVSHSPKV